MIQDSGHTPLAIRFDDITATPSRLTTANFDAVVFPGGNASGYWSGLAGYEGNIRNFVSNGGHYLGICAGSFYASDLINVWGDEHDYPLDLFAGTDTGPFNDLSTAPDDGSVAEEWKWLYYDLTPIVIDDPVLGSFTQQQFYFGGGAKDLPTGVTAVATYGDSSSTSYGLNDAIRFSYGSGRVLLSGAHPEVRSGSNVDWLFWDNYYHESTEPLNNPDNPWLFVNAVFNKWFFPTPDLVVIDPLVSDNTLITGQSFTVTATAKNQGTAASGATTLRYYRSTDSTITPSDTPMVTAGVAALAIGATSTQNASATAPSLAGTYYVGACVDSVSGESDTGNQCSTGVRITVTDPPDLVVINPSVSDNTLNTGQLFTINVMVKNQGAATSDSTTIRYYRSTDSTITTYDTQLATHGVSALTAGSTSHQGTSSTAPLAGTYYVGACIDSVSGESDTSNQCSAGVQITVTDAPPTTPDLVVLNPSVSDNTLTSGQSFTISATAKNQGDGASGATTLRYYRSTDSTIRTSDTELATDGVAGLAAGATSTQNTSSAAPSAGTYYVGACVDSVSNESNSGNQCSTGVQITVTQIPSVTGIDLVVIEPAVSDTTLTPGQSFTISATAKNQGSSTANPSWLRYYFSSQSTIGVSAFPIATDSVPTLAPGATSPESAVVSAPFATGTYWIIACVDRVLNEVDITNQCSTGVKISVSTTSPVVTPPVVVPPVSVDPNGMNMAPIYYLLLTE